MSEMNNWSNTAEMYMREGEHSPKYTNYLMIEQEFPLVAHTSTVKDEDGELEPEYEKGVLECRLEDPFDISGKVKELDELGVENFCAKYENPNWIAKLGDDKIKELLEMGRSQQKKLVNSYIMDHPLMIGEHRYFNRNSWIRKGDQVVAVCEVYWQMRLYIPITEKDLSSQKSLT